VIHRKIFRRGRRDRREANCRQYARHRQPLGQVLGVIPGVELLLDVLRRLHQDEQETFLRHENSLSIETLSVRRYRRASTSSIVPCCRRDAGYAARATKMM